MAVSATAVLQTMLVFKEEYDKYIAERFVMKDGAKALSTNDFTDALKAKLESITDETISEADIKAIFNQSAVEP